MATVSEGMNASFPPPDPRTRVAPNVSSRPRRILARITLALGLLLLLLNLQDLLEMFAQAAAFGAIIIGLLILALVVAATTPTGLAFLTGYLGARVARRLLDDDEFDDEAEDDRR